MAFEDCIAEIVAAGKGQVNEEDAADILDRALAKVRRLEKNGAPRSEALRKTSEELGYEERIAAAKKKHQDIINNNSFRKLMERSPDGKEVTAVRAALSGVEGSARDLARSADAQGKAHVDMLQGGFIGELREAGLLKVARRRNTALEQDIADELWNIRDPNAGPATGNKIARQIAEIAHRWMEVARTRQNDKGAYIGEEEHYVARSTHDSRKIAGKGQQEDFRRWFDYILPKLDDRTFEGVEDREDFLRNIWRSLASGYHNTPGGADWLGWKGPGNLAKKVSAERVLHFRTAADFYAYAQQYGQGSLFANIMRGLDHAGRNIALMDMLGTNPKAMLERWITALKDRAKARDDLDTVKKLGSDWNYKILDMLTGVASTPQNMRLAHLGRTVRALQSVMKLGGAVVSSITDLASNVAALRWNGVPLLEGWFRMSMAPFLGRQNSREIRQHLDMAGIGIGTMQGRLMTQIHAEDIPGLAGKMVNTFHRINFLSYWTDSMSAGLGSILANNLARQSAKAFDGLPRRLQITLRRYGIEAPEWEAIRRVPQTAADGNKYVFAGEIASLPDDAVKHLAKTGSAAELNRIREDLQTRLGTYLNDQVGEAMNMPRANDMAIQTWGQQAGTGVGEAARTIMQFKQFPITFTRRTLGRELMRDGVDVVGMAHLLVGTTLLGYAAMNIKEMAKGREPRQPDDAAGLAKLVTAAFLQGGGAGLYGDFLFGEANRFGGGIISSAAGPTAGTIEDVFNLLSTAREGVFDKKARERLPADLVRFAGSHTPMINLFYTKWALDHFILHRLQEAVNPGYLRRYEQRIKRENDQTFWLRPTASPYQ
jgi:hypothetical protein